MMDLETYLGYSRHLPAGAGGCGSGFESGLRPSQQGDMLVPPLRGPGDHHKNQDPEVPGQILVPAQWRRVWALEVWVPGSLVTMMGRWELTEDLRPSAPSPFQDARGPDPRGIGDCESWSRTLAGSPLFAPGV